MVYLGALLRVSGGWNQVGAGLSSQLQLKVLFQVHVDVGRIQLVVFVELRPLLPCWLLAGLIFAP